MVSRDRSASADQHGYEPAVGHKHLPEKEQHHERPELPIEGAVFRESTGGYATQVARRYRLNHIADQLLRDRAGRTCRIIELG